MKNTISFLLGFLYSFNANCQNEVSLKKAIMLTLKNNPQIKQAILSERNSEKNLEQSKLALLPSINFSSQPVGNFGRSVNPVTNIYTNGNYFAFNSTLSTQVDIFSGLQKINQIKQNKQLLNADKSSQYKTENDQIVNVMNTYLQLLTDQELLQASSQQLFNAVKNEEKIKAEYEAGKKTLVDISQARSQTSEAKYNFTNIKNELSSTRISFNQILELNDTNVIVIKPNLNLLLEDQNLTAEKMIRAAKKNDANSRLEEYKLSASELGIRIAKGALYPKLQMFSNFGTGYSSGRNSLTGYNQVGTDTIGYLKGTNLPIIRPHEDPIYKSYTVKRQVQDNFYQSFGLTLQIPILNSLQGRIGVQKAKFIYENKKLDLQIASENIEKVVGQASLDFESSKEKQSSATDTYQYNLSVFKVMTERYSIGLANSMEYNSALTDLNKSEFDMIISKNNSLFKKIILNFYIFDRALLNYLD